MSRCSSVSATAIFAAGWRRRSAGGGNAFLSILPLVIVGDASTTSRYSHHIVGYAVAKDVGQCMTIQSVQATVENDKCSNFLHAVQLYGRDGRLPDAGIFQKHILTIRWPSAITYNSFGCATS